MEILYGNLEVAPELAPSSLEPVHLGQLLSLSLLPALRLPDGTLTIKSRLHTIRIDVYSLHVDKLGPLVDLPEYEHSPEPDQSEVAGNKASVVEWGEDVEADEYAKQTADEQAQIWGPAATRGDIREDNGVFADLATLLAAETSNEARRVDGVLANRLDTLRLESPAPANENPRHGGEVGNEGDGGEINKPAEHSTGAVGSDKEGQAGQECHSTDGNPRSTILGTAKEELGRTAVLGKRVQGSAGAIEESVSTRPTGQHDDEVDESGKEARDTNVDKSQYPGGSSGSGITTINRTHEARFTGRANNSKSDDADEVDANNTVENQLRDTGNSVTRVGDLASGKSQNIRTADCEARIS